MDCLREKSEGRFRGHVLWIAVTSPKERYFEAARAYDDLLFATRIYTTEEVLAELLTFFCGDTRLRGNAVATVRAILSDQGVEVIPQSHESFLSGFELYTARPDKGYSLTDCISMQTMRRLGLTEVLTNDRHFEQEGFRALFRGQ
jgi:uncharacterized protein